MNPKQHFMRACLRSLLAVLCAILVAPGDTAAYALSQSANSSSSGDQASLIPPDQLDSLVAPIALYPDPMLAQVLAASTLSLLMATLEHRRELRALSVEYPGIRTRSLARVLAALISILGIVPLIAVIVREWNSKHF